MNVAIFGRKVNKQNASYYAELIKTLKDFGWNLIFHTDLKEKLIKKVGIAENADSFSSHEDFKSGIDLSLSMGGDGTFIQNVRFVRDSQVPVLGINTGRLGFLANIPKEEIHQAMDLVKRKEFVHQNRSLIRVETERNLFGEENVAFNEVTLQKRESASMITVHASLEGKYLNSYWADGLIVSTPSGSTAYNLSCGGPIVTPGCQVHILTPIAPHNLNVRPMVVPDHMPIKLTIDGRSRSYLIALDGKSLSIKQNEEVIIHKAEYMINVIKFEDNNFLDTIRNKMFWGSDPRN
ncbi:MAG TPA: NAD kinase [Crocinitomicaceae bacterium]|nr:NAD kinase [Crocinitomicaceae bacterium]